MNRSLDFYFEFSSPYSYLAAELIDPLAARYGFQVDWTPILLGVIFKTTGALPGPQLHPWRAAYTLADFARSAHHHGLAYRHPTRFPQATQAAARATIWLQRTAPAQAHRFAQEVFRAIYVHDGDAADPALLAKIAGSLGIDSDAMASAIQTPEIKSALADNNTRAAQAQVFGAPTFVVQGENFWGVDRLAQLEQRLRQLAGGKGYKALVDEANRQITTLPVEKALALHGREDVVFVDLRDPRELERDGVIPGAVHATRGMLEFWVDPASPYYKKVFVPDKQYVFFCAGGLRSALACRTMNEMAILPNVAHIEGGFGAWKKAGAPVADKPVRPPGA